MHETYKYRQTIGYDSYLLRARGSGELPSPALARSAFSEGFPGRLGADLLLYCTVVVMMVGFLMIYARMRRLRREMTLLVRHLAIRDAATNLSPTTPDTPAFSGDQAT